MNHTDKDTKIAHTFEIMTDKEDVAQPIQVLYRKFRRAIYGTAPEFRPFNKSLEQGRSLPQPTFLEDYEGISGEAPDDFCKKLIYVDEVYQRMKE